MKVNLNYFKPTTGKFYSTGSYETEKEQIYEIFEEVRELRFNGKLPDLVEGCTQFIVHIDVPDHHMNYPALIL